MVILHIANIETAQLGGVNIAVPNMAEAQLSFAKVGLVNLTGEALDKVPTFFVSDVYENRLPAPFDRPDLVVFHEVYRPSFLKLSRFFIKKRIPYVVIPHGCLTKTAQRQKALKKAVANLLLFRPFLKKACAIQYLSEREKSQSHISCPSFVMGNGVILPQKKKENLPSSPIRLVYIGRLDWKIKGLDLLLTAISRNHTWFQENQVTLSLYGPDQNGEHSFLRQWIETNGIADCVTLHREVQNIKKENALLVADYFIQTSRSEGMPMGLLEALSYGLPIIVTEGTGFARLAIEKNCGFGCSTTSDAIFTAIKEAVIHISEYATLSQNARKLITEQLEAQSVMKQTVSYYETLYKSPKK